MTTKRGPLVHRELNAEEAERLNPDLTPKNRTPLEVEADRIAAGGEPMSETAPAVAPARKAIIPEKYAKYTGMLGFALSFAVFLPFPPWSTGVAILGAVLALLSGGALPQFKFLEGKPILTGTALIVCGFVAEQLAVYVYHLPPGLPFNIGFLVLTVLCFLTGKAAPQPTVAVTPTVESKP